jgi:hypothetical protein
MSFQSPPELTENLNDLGHGFRQIQGQRNQPVPELALGHLHLVMLIGIGSGVKPQTEIETGAPEE